jgi:hypothetical protein
MPTSESMTRQSSGLTAAFLCLALAPCAEANWEYTKWGMTPAQVIAASHGAVHLIHPERRLGPTGPDIETRAEGSFTDGKLRLNVSFGFAGHDGGLLLVSYLVQDASQNMLLRDRLVRAYGPPAPSGDADMGSGVWRRPGQDVIDLSISDESPAFVVQRPQAFVAAPAVANTAALKSPKP